MYIPIETGSGFGYGTMMNCWPHHQATGYSSQHSAYSPEFSNVPIQFVPQGAQREQQQQCIRPRQPQFPNSAPIQSSFLNCMTPNSFTKPPNAPQTQQSPTLGCGSMGPLPARSLPAQVQRYQDEMELLMMGADVIQSTHMESSQTWNNSQAPSDRTFSVEVAGGVLGAPTPPPLIQTSNFEARYPVSPSPTQHSSYVEWLENWTQNSQRAPQPTQAPTSFVGGLPLEHSDRNINREGQYIMTSFGSHSERSGFAGSFSPATPTTFPFGACDFAVHVRRDSNEQPSYNNMPIRSFESNMTNGSDSFYGQFEWAMAVTNLTGQEKETREPSAPVQPFLMFSQPHPIVPSQRASTTPPPNKGTDYFDNKSPDSEDDGSLDLGDAVGQPEPEPEPESKKRASQITSKAQGRRNQRDELLVELRMKGLPYKEIKARGGYQEAESTLRGRFRTLTKPKNERVRKPGWTEEDVSMPGLLYTQQHLLDSCTLTNP